MIANLNIAINAATIAGKIIVDASDRIDSIRIEEKGVNDFVTSVDKKVESLLIEEISKVYPDHKILSEEFFPDTELFEEDSVWIIDPLDGTTNFIHGFPHYAISIAFYSEGNVQSGLVYNPITNELFTALRGKGARLNQNRIRASKNNNIKGSLICTGFPSKHQKRHDLYMNLVENLFSEVVGMRRTGSAALDLCYVAAGRFDAYIDTDLKVWDTAAASLVARESGVMVTDFSARGSDLNCKEILASNAQLHGKLKKLLAKT